MPDEKWEYNAEGTKRRRKTAYQRPAGEWEDAPGTKSTGQMKTEFGFSEGEGEKKRGDFAGLRGGARSVAKSSGDEPRLAAAAAEAEKKRKERSAAREALKK